VTQWLYSLWLEVWVREQLTSFVHEGRSLFDEVHANYELPVDRTDTREADFELDVIGVRGHRVFYFSCTVDSKKPLVKSKMFEAIHRAERIGGELARACVVSLHQNPTDVLRTIHQEEIWEGLDRYRLFGLDHVIAKSAACGIDEKGQPGSKLSFEEGVRRWVLGS
jgi:hypothetical protein